MSKTTRILIDQAHSQAWAVKPEQAAKMNPANPADASYAKLAESAKEAGFEVALHETGLFDASALADADVLVIPHAATEEWEKTIGVGSPVFTTQEIESIEEFVTNGGSLLLLTETEQPKYGNNFAVLAERFGIKVLNATVQDPERNHKEVPTWILPQFERLTESDFAYKTGIVCLYRAGALEVSPSLKAEVILKSSDAALPAEATLAVAVNHGSGRVVVIADSDLFGDDSISDYQNQQFWLNVAGWLGNARAVAKANSTSRETWATRDPRWIKLSNAVEALRPMQAKDGSIDAAEYAHSDASKHLDAVLESIDEFAPRFHPPGRLPCRGKGRP